MKNVVYKHTTTCMKTQYDPIPRLHDLWIDRDLTSQFTVSGPSSVDSARMHNRWWRLSTVFTNASHQPLLATVTALYLFFELFQCGRTLRHSLIRVCLYLVRRQHVVVQQELSHELVAVVDPQIGVDVERVAVVTSLVHDVVYAVHQVRSHVTQLLHIFQVRLQHNVCLHILSRSHWYIPVTNSINVS